MSEPLPSISLQKRLCYRPTKKEIKELYNIINQAVFDDQLPPTKLELKSHCRGYWGMCIANGFNVRKRYSQCSIVLSDKWYCKQWLINTLIIKHISTISFMFVHFLNVIFESDRFM